MMKKPLRMIATIGAALATTALATPAAAATFTFSFNGSFYTSGTLTVSDTADQDGGYEITGISGLVYANANTGGILDLHSPGQYQANNNLLYLNDDPVLNFQGFSFLTELGSINIYHQQGEYRAYAILNSEVFTGAGQWSLEEVDAGGGAVPEPVTWSLMLLGFAFIGASLRNRTVRKTAISYS